MRPPVRYASAEDHAVAYKVMGDGRPLVLVSNWITNIDIPDALMDRYIRGLAMFSQTAFFDQLGTGQSDPVSDVQRADRQTWVASISGVMDAVSWESAALIGYDHASLAMLAFAAAHPERVDALVMINPVICYRGADGYPSLLPDMPVSDVVEFMMALWATPEYLPFFCPSAADQDELCENWARGQRSALTPTQARGLFEMVFAADASDLVAEVPCPLLVIEQGRLAKQAAPLADRVEGTQRFSVSSPDAFSIQPADLRAVLAAVSEFLTGHPPPALTRRILTTVCFTDIVDSTSVAKSMGDEDWAHALRDHDELASSIVISHDGRVVKRTGDGVMAVFPSPSAAINAVSALRRSLVSQHLQIRAGVHTGEVDLADDGDVRGLGVHIAARLASAADPGQLLASSAVVALTVGSSISYRDLGTKELKGVGPWAIVEVTQSSP
jgi:class 3 adenylate cyclase